MPPITSLEIYFSWAAFEQKISEINLSPRLRAMGGQSILFLLITLFTLVIIVRIYTFAGKKKMICN